MGKNKRLLPILTLSALTAGILLGCNPGTGPVSSGGESVTTSNNGSGESESSKEPGNENADVIFQDLVKIYYHNDTGNYQSKDGKNFKKLWVWGRGVDGNLSGEIDFENAATPDDFGVYAIIDLQKKPFAGKSLTEISFLIKEPGTWAGQSSDTLCKFGRFIGNEETVESGRKMITIYASATSGKTVDTYAKKEEALGDRLDFARAKGDWTGISCGGTGQQNGRPATEIGACASYDLYAFDGEYYKKKSDYLVVNDNDYKIASGTPNKNSFDISIEGGVNPNLVYEVRARFKDNPEKLKSMNVSLTRLYDSEKFINEYTYNGTDLGTSEDGEYVVYKVWAPTSARAQVFIYKTGETSTINHFNSKVERNDDHWSYDMENKGHGVWEARVKKISVAARPYYTFSVTNSEGVTETNDPYAKAGGVNGIRSLYLAADQWAATNPAEFKTNVSKLESSGEFAIPSPNALSIYEVHMRDFTMDESWISKKETQRGTYAAFAESGTTYDGVSTGFDSLVDLGVNAVQLLPVFDQDNEERTVYNPKGELEVEPKYNWGYNPMNYNLVEGAYSSDPYDGSKRIEEFKGMVSNLASKGVRTIMDVVYNHMSSGTNNAFHKLVPSYYFRTDASGGFVDGTGCGNVTASERIMMRNYIINSVCFWAQEYGVKGFRFDLMGCIDITTMKEVKKALYDIDPSIVVYGEGWDGAFGGSVGLDGSLLASTGNVYKSLYDCDGKGTVGCFNDGGRDGLKGNTTWEGALPGWGFLTQDEEHAGGSRQNASLQFLGGNGDVGANPYQSVNFVDCHDNYTLFDQMSYCNDTADGGKTSINGGGQDAIDASVAAMSSVIWSQGMAFLQGGDEMLRQKYLQPDDPYFKLMGTTGQDGHDGFLLDDGNYMVRNSYAYGDECNSFKWGRKKQYISVFNKLKEALALRKSQMGDALGLSYSDVIENGKTSIWGDNGIPDATSIGINFKGNNQKQYYAYLGGDSKKEWNSLNHGNETLKVLYSSNDKHKAGDTFTVSNYSMGIGHLEMLVCQKVL